MRWEAGLYSDILKIFLKKQGTVFRRLGCRFLWAPFQNYVSTAWCSNIQIKHFAFNSVALGLGVAAQGNPQDDPICALAERLCYAGSSGGVGVCGEGQGDDAAPFANLTGGLLERQVARRLGAHSVLLQNGRKGRCQFRHLWPTLCSLAQLRTGGIRERSHRTIGQTSGMVFLVMRALNVSQNNNNKNKNNNNN